MQQFLKKIALLFIIPLAALLTTVIIWDPFKVYFQYNEYYNHNHITGNREAVCLSLFNKNKNAAQISNFIIGNSRSQAYKTNYWCKKINKEQQSCFHYDGSLFGIYRTNNLIKYLDKHTNKLNNILWIVDTDYFEEIENPKEHMFIQPPAVSGESPVYYYWTYLKASFDIKFLFFNLVFNTTGKYFDFMGHHLSKSKNYNRSENTSADLWYSYDADIANDSVGYYKNLLSKGIFFKRPDSVVMSKMKIKEFQVGLLKEIKSIIDKNNCNVKIVISPLYPQLQMNTADKKILQDIFGNENVYDFSGKNDITDNFKNYYEGSHYKPYIANLIMDSIYNSKQ